MATYFNYCDSQQSGIRYPSQLLSILSRVEQNNNAKYAN